MIRMRSRISRVFLTESAEFDALAFVEQLLAPPERLIWIKRPSRRVALEPVERALMKTVLFSAGLCGVFAISIVISFFVQFPQAAPPLVRLCVIFVLIVVPGGELFHRVFVRERRRRHYFYVLTDRRVMVVDLSASRVVFDLDVREMDMPRAMDFGGGTGTITFGPAAPRLSLWNEGRLTGDEFAEGVGLKSALPSLKLLDNIFDVLDDILAARDAAFKGADD
jgi:hypothetical protein